MNSSVSYVAAILLAIGGGAFLTKITSVSPVYFLTGLSALLLFASTRVVVYKKKIFPYFPFFILLILLFVRFIWNSPVSGLIGYAMNLSAIFISIKLFSVLKLNELISVRKYLIVSTILFGCVEFFVRYFFPFQELSLELLDYIEESGSYFYLYKFNSIMYMDSNFVATWLLTTFVFSVTSHEFDRNYSGSVILFLLLCATISRASILAATLFLVVNFISRYRISALFKVAISIFILSFMSIYFFIKFSSDDSLSTKFLILGLAASNYLGNFNLTNFLFGSGINSSVNVLGGISAHNYFLELAIDIGIVGLLSVLLIHLFYIKHSRVYLIPVFLCFYVSGLSFSPTTIPYLYILASLALYLNMEKKSASCLNEIYHDETVN